MEEAAKSLLGARGSERLYQNSILHVQSFACTDVCDFWCPQRPEDDIRPLELELEIIMSWELNLGPL